MHVLVIHIGPVQEFIASARKCRDLWFGSWIISELARAAAKGVVTAEGREPSDVLVFPGASIDDRDRSVANKIVARILQPANIVAEQAEMATRKRLVELRDRAFARANRRRGAREGFFRAEVATQQVDEAFEFLWAASPETDQLNAYKNALDDAERLLAAVKNSRVWSQPPWAADGVPKSTLDGLREAVIKPERLCGVGVLKRFGVRDEDQASDGMTPERIPSTLHIASGPFRKGIGAIDAQKKWDEYRADLNAIDRQIVSDLTLTPRPDEQTGRVDGTVFYENRLIEAMKEMGIADEDKHKRAKIVLRKFLRDMPPSLREPIPYYALLLADGDRMGKVINSLTSPKDHRNLSDTLESFASSTRKTIETDHDGALIYAGGDDVLALLPLHNALTCATKLAKEFATQMRPWKITEDDGQKRSPTLSMGLVIVHQLFPLDEALEMVRRTEKVAKDVPNKNAVAIVVKKRGGEPIGVEGRWGMLDERLRTLIGLHLDEAISSKAQYELMDLAERLDGAGELTETLKRVREAEAKRILARKRKDGGGALMDDAVRERLASLGAFDDPARLGRELYVASLLAQAARQANPPAMRNDGASGSEVSR